MSTDETENRADMERQVTDNDRRREADVDRDGGVGGYDDGRARGSELDRDRDHDGVPDNEERRAAGGRDLDRDGVPDNRERQGAYANETTRSMPVTGAAATGAGAGYAAGDAYSRDGRRLVAPGFARGRLHVGINWGAAFFGWVVALGLAVILTAVVAAIGAAVSVSRGATTADQAASQLGTSTQTVGVVGLVLLAVIAFVSYYGGGYVAARMSRFDGARQGFAVWLWAIIVAIVVAIVAAAAGAKFDVLSSLNAFPRIPVDQGDLTGTGIVALIVLLVITLLGAVIGGAGGMRYHRRLESAEADLADGV